MPALIIPALIGGAATIGSAAIGASAAKSAAQTQADAANRASSQYDPWRQSSLRSLGELESEFGGAQPQATFTAPTLEQAQNMPAYQFQLQQGEQALQRAASARGTLLTGGTAKAISRYGQDYAQTAYSNLFNQSLSTFEANQQARQNRFNQLSQMANPGAVNAVTGGLTNFADLLAQQQALNRIFPKGGQASGYSSPGGMY
jgi:hypothetical protein